MSQRNVIKNDGKYLYPGATYNKNNVGRRSALRMTKPGPQMHWSVYSKSEC